jgi:2-phospho-L-lactate guanylyltransferase
VTAAVLVPVKAFHEAKLRLAEALGEGERAALARRMATTVVAAAGGLPVSVVCDDELVAAWAASVGAEVVWCPGRGLNRAVEEGVTHLQRAGVERVIVAHADLPLADELGWAAEFDGITLVPDRHGDGTNVICVPAAAGFRFAYGAGSFARHRAEAERLGLPVRTVDAPRLAWDVDLPADLDVPDPSELAAPRTSWT